MSEMKENRKDEFLKYYDEYSSLLFRFAFSKTNDRELAKDMTQDTFIKSFEYLQKGESIKNIKAFLYQVMRNIIIDYYRKKKSLSLDENLESGLEISETNKESKIFENSEEQEAVKMLNSLEEPYRETLILRFVEDLSVNDIAEVLKTTPNVVSVRISRGLEKLRELLGVNK